MTNKKFMYSKLELRLLKSEYERVLNGNCFLYEKTRFNETKALMEQVNQKYVLLKVKKSVNYKPF